VPGSGLGERQATLFIALALFGLTLVVAPRLAKR
jgi:hypothetical protein